MASPDDIAAGGPPAQPEAPAGPPPAEPWGGHRVPWPPGASPEEAQAVFDRSVDKVRLMMRAIDAQEPVTVVRKGDVSASDLDEIRAALDAYCTTQWGQPLAWRTEDLAEDGETWTGTVPAVELPPVPERCATCGAALDAGDSRLRFLPGGWEHQCYSAQAGHFPASPDAGAGG